MNWMNGVLGGFFILAIGASYYSYKKKDIEYSGFIMGVIIFTILGVLGFLA